MKASFSLWILLLVLLGGCTSQATMKLNDTIVKANADLKDSADIFNNKFEAVSDHNYTLLESDRKKLIALIDRKLKEIASLKADMPGGEEFRDAFVDYYKFERDIYETDFKEICKLNGDGAVGNLAMIALQMKDKSKKEEAMERGIHSAQEKFAEKNNLKLR